MNSISYFLFASLNRLLLEQTFTGYAFLFLHQKKDAPLEYPLSISCLFMSMQAKSMQAKIASQSRIDQRHKLMLEITAHGALHESQTLQFYRRLLLHSL